MNNSFVYRIINQNAKSKMSLVSLDYKLFLDIIGKKSPYAHKPVMIGSQRLHQYDVNGVPVYVKWKKEEGKFLVEKVGMKTSDAKKCLITSKTRQEEFAF